MLPISLNVAFSQTKIKNKYFVGSFIESNTKVIRFDVTVNKVAVVDVFNTRDHLINQHQHTLQGELAEGLIEETFEGWPHKIHDQNVVVTWVRRSVP